jgi:hypothetical protein
MTAENPTVLDSEIFAWQEIGVLHFPGIALAHLPALQREFQVLIEDGALKADKRSFCVNGYARSVEFNKFLNSSGLRQYVEQLFSAPLQRLAGDISIYAGCTKWHCDVQGGSLRLAKLALYVSTKSFCFSYVPGSHNVEGTISEKLSVIVANRERLGKTETPSFQVAGGDVVLFSPRLLHAVYDESPRQQIAVLYAAEPHDAAQRAELHQLTLANISVM